jgi:hypothetical protein
MGGLEHWLTPLLRRLKLQSRFILMGVSLFSRFQGCLLMTFLAAGNNGGINETAITANLELWSSIFHSSPYAGTLPPTVWQKANLRWQGPGDFCHWLVVLALWHHENAAGFSTDLGRSVAQFSRQFPDYALSPLDQAWLHLWQTLLTWILSERFTPAQWPDLWRSPSLVDSLGLTPPMAQDCQRDLAAIATALSHYRDFPLPPAAPDQLAFAISIPHAIYDWGITPTQPRFTIHRSQTRPNSAEVLPFTSALSGAYNGGTIINQALQTSQCCQTSPIMSLICRFAHQHCQHWLGSLSTSSNVLPLAIAAPLVMQRRSGLKLVSQQDYD